MGLDVEMALFEKVSKFGERSILMKYSLLHRGLSSNV